MPGYDKRSREHQVTNTFFIHNVFGSFFNGILNWFDEEFYPRFNYKVIGSFDKAIEFFKKKKIHGTEITSNILPSITLDPMIDFSNAEHAGKFLWQHSRYAPAMGLRLWPSIDLKEQDIIVTPVHSRYQGTFEVTFWLSSIYEIMDFRVALLQFCGGFNRWCRPDIFWTYLMLPESIAEYEKEDGEQIDWGNTLSEVMHIQTINKHKRVIPLNLHPMWRLESFSDNSTKHGGDNVSEHKLTASFGYEVNLPTYIVLSEHIDPTLTLNLSMGSTHTKYPMISPYKIISALKDTKVYDKFFENGFNFYRIENDIEERDNLLIDFSENSLVYPIKLQVWSHISSGVLLYINDEFISDPKNKVKRDNIIVIDSYKKDYLPYLRKACAAISINDTGSDEFYSKCEIMKKPCICNLTNEEKSLVLSKVDECVTLDTRRRKIYDGELTVIEVNSNDAASNFDALLDIKEVDPDAYKEAMVVAKDGLFPYDLPMQKATEHVNHMSKRLVCDYTDGLKTQFPMGYILDDKNTEGLLIYVNDVLQIQDIDYSVINNNQLNFISAPARGSSIYIGGELLVIKESKLVAMYEFTQGDIDRIEDNIVIDIAEPIDRHENIIVVSYGGKLNYGDDYEIDIDANTITLKIKPIIGEMVQFFYYV